MRSFLVWWALSWLSACGVSVQAGGRCTAACSGCCDASGQCVAGAEATACGIGGATCSACPSGVACVSGQCGVLQATGGGAAGGPGETCDSARPLTLSPVPGDPVKQEAAAMGTTSGARDDEGGQASSCAGAGPELFYSVDVPAGRLLSVKVITGGAWRAVVRARTRSCAEPADLCSTAAPGSTTASLTVPGGPARRVTVTVDGVDSTATGPFELQLETRADTSTDGGTPVDAWCQALLDAQSRLLAGRARCESADGGVTLDAQRSSWSQRLPLCSASERALLDAFLTCLEAAPPCTMGQEPAALASLESCTAPVLAASTGGQLSGACKDALRR